jgi:hypothetical protein
VTSAGGGLRRQGYRCRRHRVDSKSTVLAPELVAGSSSVTRRRPDRCRARRVGWTPDACCVAASGSEGSGQSSQRCWPGALPGGRSGRRPQRCQRPGSTRPRNLPATRRRYRVRPARPESRLLRAGGTCSRHMRSDRPASRRSPHPRAAGVVGAGEQAGQVVQGRLSRRPRSRVESALARGPVA